MKKRLTKSWETKIRKLREAACAHGDRVQAHICAVALGDETPILDLDQIEYRYGGGGLDPYEELVIRTCTSQVQAIELCRDAFADWGIR